MKLTASQNGGIRADGNVQKHQGERELTNGFNLIFLGDGFTSDDLIAETGVFDLAVEEACEALFPDSEVPAPRSCDSQATDQTLKYSL